ncbi:hypothetical protein DMH27_00880 [Raoultella planticola]|nr:hypothetical protein [Raoultella planticola]
MSLDNQYSYAPVIRGVARTNARLTVRQRDAVIYSTLLTPAHSQLMICIPLRWGRS